MKMCGWKTLGIYSLETEKWGIKYYIAGPLNCTICPQRFNPKAGNTFKNPPSFVIEKKNILGFIKTYFLKYIASVLNQVENVDRLVKSSQGLVPFTRDSS